MSHVRIATGVYLVASLPPVRRGGGAKPSRRVRVAPASLEDVPAAVEHAVERMTYGTHKDLFRALMSWGWHAKGSVAAAARRIGVSRGTMGKRLAEVGTTPSTLVNLGRFIRAAALIEEGQLSLSDVAPLVGKADVFGLSNWMHHHYGIRPSQLREEVAAS